MQNILFGLLMVIGFNSNFVRADESPLVKTPILSSTTEALKARRALLRTWAPKCSDGSLTMSSCPFWDAVEYMGMLCLSGETEYCDQVKNAQDASGRFFRSPEYRLHPKPENGPTFSRDMDRGVWGYVIATGDKEVAAKYMNYVKGNGYHLCPKSKESWEACTTRATYWTFVTQVFNYLNLPHDKKKMNDYKFTIESIYSPLESQEQPLNFEMILNAEELYTYQKMAEKGAKLKNTDTYRKLARIIHKRDPENAFYEYLVYGANESSAQKILKMCPSDRPVVPNDLQGNPVYTEPANGPWEKGSGHYCIFMINAILGSAK